MDCMTLPDFLATQGVDARNLVLKVDTEGAERDIIIGLKNWIAEFKPSMLLSMVRRACGAGLSRGQRRWSMMMCADSLP